MKTCPRCTTTYGDDKKFCPRDGTPLADTPQDALTLSTNPSERSQSPDLRTNSLIGTVLAGRYRILSLIGKGGMGEVYQAQHILLGRTCAVKIISPESAHDHDTLARFKREAEMSSRLNHPNAVTVHDFGETDDGLVFLAMELIEGRQLSELMQPGQPFPLERALSIVKQVGDALQAAHSQGIVHRDLKPDNILVCADDRVKVVDFGIAKSTLVDAKHRQLTRTGFILGTPQYMSPEQVLSEPLDARSDIYSLGLIVYELLTGCLPFQGETIQAQMVNRIAEPPIPLREARPGLGIPPAVEMVVMKALAREPDMRYRSALEFVSQLEQAIRLGTHETPKISTDPRGQAQTQPALGYGTPAIPAYSNPTIPAPLAQQPYPVYQNTPQPGYSSLPPQPFPTPTPQPFQPLMQQQFSGPQPGPFYPPQPPPVKKSKAGLIAGVAITSVLVVGGAGAAYVLWPNPKPKPKPYPVEDDGTDKQSRIRKSVLRSRELREQRRFDDALTEIEKALILDKESSAALIEKAEIYWEQQKTVAAEDLVYKVYNRDPNFAPARQNLGVIYSRQGKTDDAIREEKKALELNPEAEYAAYAHSVLSSIYRQIYFKDKKANAYRLNDAESEARAALSFATRKSIEITPRKVLATVYIERSQYGLAREQLQQILKDGAGDVYDEAEVHNQYGLIAFYQKNWNEAVREFERAVALNKNYKTYQDNLDLARKKKAEAENPFFVPPPPGGSSYPGGNSKQ
ncbi:MAG: protein kinase [Blastocatellia bacterium]|nr:protein kinase [Blastocatellia bacterium]